MATCQEPSESPLPPKSLQRGPSLADNLDRQSSELEVLQGMFGEDVSIITENQEFRVTVLVDVPPSVQSFKLLTPLASTKPMKTKKEIEEGTLPPPPPAFERQVSTDGQSCFPLSLSYLPPLHLYVSYHDRYPSEKPPYFDINAKWLERKCIPRVREVLEKQFTPGCEFVYDLVEQIRAEFLSLYLSVQASEHHFQIDEKTNNVSLQKTEDQLNPGVMFVRSSSVISDLEEYDKFRQHDIFMSNKHMCSVCVDQKKGECFPETGLACGHLFCIECLAQYCEIKLNTGGVAHLLCPMPECNVSLSPPLLKIVLTKKMFSRYERLLEEYMCDVTPGVVYCPRPGCGARVFSNPDDSLAVCDQCRYPFCKECNKLWHGDSKCKHKFDLDGGPSSIREQLQELQESRKELPEHKKSELVADLLASIWVASNSNVKKCPNCSYIITKDGGCNKMLCIRCSSPFCWICGKAINGYSHFENNRECKLFRDTDYLPAPELEDVNAGVLRDADALELLLHPRCPKCSMENLKKYHEQGNNRMTCNSCQFCYCFLCLEPCFGTWHFSDEYGCKQFTTFKQDRAFVAEKKNDDDTTQEETPLVDTAN